MGFQISLCKFQKNSLSERPLEGKAVILWDQLEEHKEVSQKASFQFLPEDLPFFTIGLYGIPNISLQIPQEESKRKVSWGVTCNTVRWLTEHKAVSQKASWQFLTEDISFFTVAL